MKKKYVIVSPVRNEEEHLEKTLNSVLKQSILPVEWVLVDDGSIDNTSGILETYALNHSWIKVIHLADRGYYLPGEGVVNVFYKGYESITIKDYDFLVKLDCDLSFSENYFESLLMEFDDDPKLGIASGRIFNYRKGKLVCEKAQEDHPFGASKMYRKTCFDQIGGLRRIPGWDLADIVSAQINHWHTRCFFNLEVAHYKPGGSRRTGLTKGKFLQGRFQYRFGYTFLYTFLKSIYHLTARPFVISGVGLITGYLYAAIRKEKKYFEPEMISFLRKRQKTFLLSKLGITRKI
ncbi:MAG: glycosyltransferase family A protein [Bacteroidales bacterium]|jgi:glycosyltransferase involved in cell wall biosynthesis|nr:glycosyltransferase family A protein [Bacteroidales bacterium]NLM93409.1 glycosyltransferase family 2 protein [Bacteroidales bacterium]